MKKMFNFVLFAAGMALVMASGFGTVKAEATEGSVTTMAEVVRELKEGYGKSVTYCDEETRIDFSWDIWAETKWETMIDEITGTPQQGMLEGALDRVGWHLYDYRNYMTDWHIVTEISYHPYTTLVMV